MGHVGFEGVDVLFDDVNALVEDVDISGELVVVHFLVVAVVHVLPQDQIEGFAVGEEVELV